MVARVIAIYAGLIAADAKRDDYIGGEIGNRKLVPVEGICPVRPESACPGIRSSEGGSAANATKDAANNKKIIGDE